MKPNPNSHQMIHSTETEQAIPISSVSRDGLLSLALKNVELFCSEDKIAFARVRQSTHFEIHGVESEAFGDWLGQLALVESGEIASTHALKAAIDALRARARFSGKTESVHLRAATQGGKYYIDLCDPCWRVIEIDADGWRILNRSPVAFTRTAQMLALPEPSTKGNFKRLLEVANVPEHHLAMVLAWCIEALRPDTPYVGLELVGAQGSAKSTTQRMLRELVDPNAGNLRVKPRSRSDISVAGQNSHVISYENLSGLSGDMQDALCSVLTGAADATRRFFTNSDEVVLKVKRPVMLNGINRVVTQPDLVDRFISIELSPLAGVRSEIELQAQFEALKPIIFGGLLKWFWRALAKLPEVQGEKPTLPRMADFALLGEAVVRARKGSPGEFLRKYQALRRKNVDQVIDASPVGAAVIASLDKKRERLSGTVKEVYEVLRRHYEAVRNGTGRGNEWPASEKAFANELRRLAPAFKQLGVMIEIGERTARGYPCRIWRE